MVSLLWSHWPCDLVQPGPTIGEPGSLGSPRVGDWSGDWGIIGVANVSKMQERVLILCRLKMQEKVEDYCGVGHSPLLRVEGEALALPGCPLTFTTCAVMCMCKK